MMKPKKKRLNRSAAGDTVILIILVILGGMMVLPLVFAISMSFKPINELFIFPPKFFPNQPTIQNYRDLLSLMSNSWVPFTRYLYNTLFITVLGTAGHIVFAAMCAYPLAVYRYPGSKAFYRLVMLALMFSSSVTTIPNYLTMAKLGWVDTHFALIIPYFASPLGLFLIKPFIEQNVPKSLVESAKMDGAKEMRIFWTIVMPLIKPAWLTLIVFSVQSLWSMGNNMYIYTEQLKTLNYAMSQIVAGGISRAGVSAAVAVIMMLVPISVFVITQSNVVETMASSGIKE